MSGAVLRVSGSKAGVARFLESTAWVPLTVYWKGQPRFAGSRKISLVNGFNLSVSDASGSNLPQQVRDAKRFLARNGKEIGRLRRLRLTAVLDFGVDAATKGGVFFLRFDQHLISALAVAGFGLEVSCY
jgi:hypothetical protein